MRAVRKTAFPYIRGELGKAARKLLLRYSSVALDIHSRKTRGIGDISAALQLPDTFPCQLCLGEILLTGDIDVGILVDLGWTNPIRILQPSGSFLLAILLATYPLEEEIVGEQAQREFLRLFGAILKLRNVLSAFDEFTAEFANGLMAPRLVQDYQSRYISIYELLRRLEPQKEDVTDDLVFEAELLRQDEINIDYILLQAKKRHEDNCTDEELKVEINSLVDASLDLRSKKELIAAFISRLCDVGWDEEQCGSWQAFAREQRGLKLQEIISEEKLKPDPTINFMERCLNSDFFDDTGTNVDDLMPPVSHFGTGRATLKERIIQKLRAFFDMFRGT